MANTVINAEINYQQVEVVMQGDQVIEVTLFADPGATAALAQRAEIAAVAAEQAENNTEVKRQDVATRQADVIDRQSDVADRQTDVIDRQSNVHLLRDETADLNQQAGSHRAAAEQAQNLSEQARDQSGLSATNSANSATASEQSRLASENARNISDLRATDSEAARDAAQSAETQAGLSRDQAVAARLATESARDTTLTARDTTLTARDVTVTNREDAETARTGAEDARDASVSAQGASEAARDVSTQKRNEAQAFRNQAQEFRNEAEDFAAIASTAFKYMGVWDVTDGNPPVPLNMGQPIDGFYTVNGDGFLYGIEFDSGDEIVYQVDTANWKRVGRQRPATADRDKTNNVDLFLARGMKEHIDSDDHDGRYPLNTDSRLSNSREWTASTVSQAEAETGAATTNRKWTAQRVRQAIVAWWNGSAAKAKLDGIEAGAEKNPATTASRSSSSTTTVLQAKAMNDHRSSGDHDGRYWQPGLDISLASHHDSAVTKLLGSRGSDGATHYVLLCRAGQTGKTAGMITGSRGASGHNATGLFLVSAGTGGSSLPGASVVCLQTQVDGVSLVTLTHAGVQYIALSFTRSLHQEYNSIYFRGDSTHLSDVKLVEAADVLNVAPFTGGNGLGLKLLGGSFSGDGSGLVGLNATNLASGTLPAARIPFGSGANTVTEGNDARLSNSREWMASTVSATEAEAGTSTARRAWTAQRVRQAALLAVVKIGFVYVQFPGMSAPSSLFGGTWTRRFDTEGIFFRTEGGEASAFGSGIQADQMQLLTGQLYQITQRPTSNANRLGVFSATTRISNDGLSQSGTRYAYYPVVDFNSSNSPNARTSATTSGQTFPRNRTIRVWEKTGN
ncbi:hypothetical protein NFC81_09080 [Salinispirillum sp. LH 10-3-1]|uniref:Uncharacterized protein n=1 Tax=Salinispirillum sp. LH 10-3-1 TaxID=2952525 RepID=A0AB38YBZ2_9GAMM